MSSGGGGFGLAWPLAYCRAGGLWLEVEQVADTDFKGVGKRADIFEGRVAHTPLHTGQVSHMDGGAVRHFFLGQT